MLERDGGRAQPDRAGPRRDPQPHRLRPAGDSRGQGGAVGRPGCVHQSRHRRRGAGGDHHRLRPARGGDRAARVDGLEPHRHARATTSSTHRGRPATSPRATRSAVRCCGCASSCSSGSISDRSRAAITSGCSARCAGCSTHYTAHPDELPDGSPGDDAVQTVTDYVAGMTDRFCIARYRQIALPEESRAVSLFTPGDDRAGQGCGPDRRDRLRPTPTCGARGSSYTGLCPFHEERTPSFSVNAHEKLYYCFGCEASGDVIPLRPGEGGAELPRGGGGARRALRRRDRARAARTRELEQRRRRRARLTQLLERTSSYYAAIPVGVAEGGEGEGVPVRARAGRGGAARRSRWGSLRRIGGRFWPAPRRPGSASRSCVPRGSSRRVRRAASTIVSARGSRSRSAIRAGVCSGSARGR